MFYCSILLYNFYNFLFSFNSGVIWNMNVRYLLNQIISVGTRVRMFQSTWRFILVAFLVSFLLLFLYYTTSKLDYSYHLFISLTLGIFSHGCIASFFFCILKISNLVFVTQTSVILKGRLTKPLV